MAIHTGFQSKERFCFNSLRGWNIGITDVRDLGNIVFG
jgi:hypothetical protein